MILDAKKLIKALISLHCSVNIILNIRLRWKTRSPLTSGYLLHEDLKDVSTRRVGAEILDDVLVA